MKQEEEGKLFVGGLAQMTTAEKMRHYFSQYGEVIESSVLEEKDTGLSRGFGFVKFQDPSSVETVLKARTHVIDGKKVDPKPCTPKDIQKQKKEAEIEHIKRYKIFVGGLTQNMTVDEVRTYFEQFGPTAEVVFALTKGEDRKNKGFGFVTFETEIGATAAVEKHFHEIGGKTVEAKRATPRDKMRSVAQTAKPSSGDNIPQSQTYYGQGWGGQMQWMPPNYGMPPHGPGSYPMPQHDSGYGSYTNYGSSQTYSYPPQGYGNSSYNGSSANSYSSGSYSDMGKYNSSQSSTYSKSNRSSADPRIHPYKRK